MHEHVYTPMGLGAEYKAPASADSPWCGTGPDDSSYIMWYGQGAAVREAAAAIAASKPLGQGVSVSVHLGGWCAGASAAAAAAAAAAATSDDATNADMPGAPMPDAAMPDAGLPPPTLPPLKLPPPSSPSGPAPSGGCCHPTRRMPRPAASSSSSRRSRRVRRPRACRARHA